MTDEELKRLLDAYAERIESKFEKRFDAVDSRFEALDKKVDAKVAELRSHFDTTVEHFDRKFDFLAEGLINLDEKLERKTSAIETRMEQGFAETHALIKFSYSELDRRVRATEQSIRTIEETPPALKRGSKR